MGLFASKTERMADEGRRLIYKEGKLDEGIALLEQAAQKDEPSALMTLAEMYHSGEVRDGGPQPCMACAKNDARALELYNRLPDCPPVLYRRAEIFFHGDGVPRNDAVVMRLFREVENRAAEKSSRKLAGLLGIMRLWRSGLDGEALAQDARAYLAAMQFWGRGTEQNRLQADRALCAYAALRAQAGATGSRAPESDVSDASEWDADVRFCYEQLRYEEQGRGYLADAGRQALLADIYRRTADPRIRLYLEREMLFPVLRESFVLDLENGDLSAARKRMQPILDICRCEPAHRAAFGSFLARRLADETKRFAADKDYLAFLALLECCSEEMDSLSATIELLHFHYTYTVKRAAAKGAQGSETAVSLHDDMRRVLRRLCDQLETELESSGALSILSKEELTKIGSVLFWSGGNLRALSERDSERLSALYNSIRA